MQASRNRHSNVRRDTRSPDVLSLSAATAKIADVEILPFRQVVDHRGTLTVCQWNEQLPFTARRMFFVHSVPNESIRGEHAHRKCQQALVCICGRVSVCVDDGTSTSEHVLNSSDQGIYIPAGIWASQSQFSKNAVLAVFASHDYAEESYIRDYDEFLIYRRSRLDSAA